MFDKCSILRDGEPVPYNTLLFFVNNLLNVGAGFARPSISQLPIHSGKGWWLIAGYNMSSKNEREKYDEQALCGFIGKVIIAIGVLTFPLGIASIVGWYWIAYTAVILAVGIFACIYANTGNRFKK
jgi:hypothetical protein